MKKIKVTINGNEIITSSEKTILEVVNENIIDEIPTLCYDKRLEPYGSCFLCVVEIEGLEKLMPSCCTLVENGMKIHTNNEKIKRARKTALELLLSNHYADCIGPCKDACPAGVDVQGYIALISRGKYDEAIRLIKNNNPLPLICGRICVRECEIACQRNIVDESVAINNLKRYAADIDIRDPWKPVIKEKINRKIAVIGGGPSGLSCAYYLTINGCDVTIFEKMSELGGMLRYGIPEYRLPKNILDKEINWIVDLGIDINVNTEIGKDIKAYDLLNDGYEAIYLAIGATKSRNLGIKNEEDAGGVTQGIDFLRDIQLKRHSTLKGTVLIVGGGNTALDAARSALRLGAENVKIVYRRSINEMPAHHSEIKAAKEEGTEFIFLTTPKSILKELNKIKGIECLKMRLEKAKANERPKPVPIPNSEFVLSCDYLINAIGQKVDNSFFHHLDGCKREKWGTIRINNESFETSVKGVFAGGDAVTGPLTAINAITQGRKAAESIYEYLRNGNRNKKNAQFFSFRHQFGDISEYEFSHIEKIKRENMTELKPEVRKKSFDEVEVGFSYEQAFNESQRCLECGCFEYYECALRKYASDFGVDIAPFTGEIRKYTIDKRHPFITFDPNKCINCGRCVRTCSEILKVSALGFVYRGFKTIVKPALEKPLLETNCISCGNCIDACPTGAVSEKYNIRIPGTLKRKSYESVCNFCSIGCKINYKIIDDDTLYVSNTTKDIRNSHNNGYLCAKGRFGHRYLLSKNRLKRPIIQDGNHSREIKWDEAIQYTGHKLKEIIKKTGSDSIAVFGSPKLSNEELYLLQKMARGALRTNNIASFSNLLYGFEQDSLDDSLGLTVSTTTMDEIENSDIIIIMNLGVSEENLLTELKIKAAQKKGAKLILINSSEIKLTKFSDLWIDSKRGTNTALINGVLRELIRNGRVHNSSIQTRMEAFLDLQKMVDAYPPERIKSLTGVEPGKYAKLVKWLENPDLNLIVIYNIDSLTEKARNDLKAIGNFLLLTDRMNRKGNGLIILRDFSNSNGLLDMGVSPRYLPGYVKYHEDEKIERLSRLWRVDLKKIFKPVNITKKMLRNEIKAVLIFGEDPLISNDNIKYLGGAEFLVVCDMFYTATAKEADVVLPASAYIEQDGTYTSSDLRIQKVDKIIMPKNGLENYKIIIELANIFNNSFSYESQNEIFEEIKQVNMYYKDCNIGDSWVKNLNKKANFSIYDVDIRAFNCKKTALLFSENFFETKIRSILFGKG